MVEYLLDLFGNKIPGELTVFVLSLIPLVELRGGILAAKALDVELWKAFFLCLAGTMAPIPFILLFIRKIMDWLRNTRLVKLVDRLEAKAERKIQKIEKYETMGLVIFVAIPLPGTGAWTGALAAAVMQMKFKNALGSILLGSVIADIIMCLVSYGVLGLIF